jgi:hypothetical protein
MTTHREVMQQALEALEQLENAACKNHGDEGLRHYIKSITALRDALAEPQKPVGTYEEVMQTMRSLQTGTLVAQQQMFALLKDKPLYAEPQPKAEPYDQTALELCEVCGWKTLIPTEGCLNCERQPKAEQDGAITDEGTRAQALEEAAGVTGEFAQKWWSIHCASNKHMETTRKAHDDFCALQAAIRQLKEKT